MRGRVCADVNGGRHAGTCQGGFLSLQIVAGVPIPLTVIRHRVARATANSVPPSRDPPMASPILDMCHSKLLSRAPGRERRGANGFLKESFITGLGRRSPSRHNTSVQRGVSHFAAFHRSISSAALAPSVIALPPAGGRKHHAHTQTHMRHWIVLIIISGDYLSPN